MPPLMCGCDGQWAAVQSADCAASSSLTRRRRGAFAATQFVVVLRARAVYIAIPRAWKLLGTEARETAVPPAPPESPQAPSVLGYALGLAFSFTPFVKLYGTVCMRRVRLSFLCCIHCVECGDVPRTRGSWAQM